MSELDGLRTLVTGGAQGLGRAIAALFIERGAQVMIGDIDDAAMAATAAALGCPATRCDVTVTAEVESAVAATVSAFGGLDCLVNNAGIEIVVPLMEQDEAGFARMLDINVLGVWRGMKAAAPALGESRRASIVNIASLAGTGGAALFGGYCASKAGVIQLTRVAALELRPLGIRVNAVCPGFVGTAMVERLAPIVTARAGVPFDALVAMRQGRLGTAEEVAEMVAYFAGGDAGWTTGSHFVMDGGLSAGLV